MHLHRLHDGQALARLDGIALRHQQADHFAGHRRLDVPASPGFRRDALAACLARIGKLERHHPPFHFRLEPASRLPYPYLISAPALANYVVDPGLHLDRRRKVALENAGRAIHNRFDFHR